MSSFELPAELPTSKEEQDALRFSIAYRTIITAAPGGSLRSLKIIPSLEHPFAIRALLPYWLLIDPPSVSGCQGTWELAARTLRPALAHASLWLGANSDPGAREDRRLTREEVQSLHEVFSGAALPRFFRPRGQYQAVMRYLAWMEQDEELAQQVADAWNVIEGRGKADENPCGCTKCPNWLHQYIAKMEAEEGGPVQVFLMGPATSYMY